MSFDVAAEAYDGFMGRYSRLLSGQLADLAAVRFGQRAIDVGCGTGALTGELVGRLGAGAVAAVDPSASFVAATRERYPAVDVREAPAERLPFDDGVFDARLAQLVVHFMRDPVAGLAGDASRHPTWWRRSGVRLGSRRPAGAPAAVLGRRPICSTRTSTTSHASPGHARATSRSCSGTRASAT